MNALLLAIAAVLVFFGLKSGGNPFAALAASIGLSIPSLTPGDTILPNGQPAQMTADQWNAWIKTEIDKLLGTAVGSYQKSAKDRAWFAQCIAARQLLDRPSGTVSYSAWSLSVCAKAAKPGAGLKAVSLIGAAANAIPVVGQLISLVTLGIGSLFTHHAQAVAKENSYLCSLVPSANATLADIDARFRDGTIASPQATQELDEMVANFMTSLAPVISGGANFKLSYGTGNQCNLGCLYSLALAMIRDVREQVDY